MAPPALAATMPTEADSSVAKETSRLLASRLKKGAPMQLRILDDGAQATVKLPAPAVGLLLRILEEMARGNAVTIARRPDPWPWGASRPRWNRFRVALTRPQEGRKTIAHSLLPLGCVMSPHWRLCVPRERSGSRSQARTPAERRPLPWHASRPHPRADRRALPGFRAASWQTGRMPARLASLEPPRCLTTVLRKVSRRRATCKPGFPSRTPSLRAALLRRPRAVAFAPPVPRKSLPSLPAPSLLRPLVPSLPPLRERRILARSVLARVASRQQARASAHWLAMRGVARHPEAEVALGLLSARELSWQIP